MSPYDSPFGAAVRWNNEFGVERRLVNASSSRLNLGKDPNRLLDTWIILYSIGQVLVVFLLGTMLFARRERWRRGPTLINMMFDMLLSTIPPCILYYAGEQNNPSPPIGLCLAQATLKHGTGPMFLISLLALVVDISMATNASIKSNSNRYAWFKLLLLVSPYITFLVWSIPVAIMGSQNLENVGRLEQSFYCSYANNQYGDSSTVFGIATILATIGFECYTILILNRSWCAVRDLRESRDIDMSLIIRVGVFSLLEVFFVVITIIATVLSSGRQRDVANDVSTIFEAFAPIGLFAIFGLRPDIIRTWMFWRSQPEAPHDFTSITHYDPTKQRPAGPTLDTMTSVFSDP